MAKPTQGQFLSNCDKLLGNLDYHFIHFMFAYSKERNEHEKLMMSIEYAISVRLYCVSSGIWFSSLF